LKPYMDTEPLVRSYRQGDELAIPRLFNLCFGESGAYLPFTPDVWFWRYVLRPAFDPESVLVIEESGRVVSSIVMTYVTMSVNGSPRQVALVGDVSTHPRYRHRGYATKLMRRAVDLARERGCWALHLTADPEGNAIRIYRALGFETFVEPVIMVSALRGRRGANAVGLVPSIPLFVIDSILGLRGMRRSSDSTRVKAIQDERTRISLLATHQAAWQRNGCLMMGEDYARWLSGPRPAGGVGVFSVERSGQRIGMATVSAINVMLWGKSINIASIANPVVAENEQDAVTLGQVLMKVREFAANQLGCVAASIIVDPRDAITLRACRLARFFRTVSVASMIHPLGDTRKMHELRRGYWSQPLEAAKPVP
jgi:GNAT superfamily N-acetyltransferase